MRGLKEQAALVVRWAETELCFQLISEQNHSFSTRFLRANLVYVRMCCNINSSLSCTRDGFQPAQGWGQLWLRQEGCGVAQQFPHSATPTMRYVGLRGGD